MRLAYVGTLPPHPGGSAILAAQILRGLDRAGHAVQAISPVTRETQEQAAAYAAKNPEIAIERFEVPYFESSPDLPSQDGYRGLEGREIERRLVSLMEAERPDVVVIGRETFAWHVGPIARRYALPTVLLVQGGTTFGILHGTLPKETAERLLGEFRKVDRIVVVAEHLAARLRGLGFEDCIAIPNPVDAEKFQPAEKPPELLRHHRISSETVILHPSNLKNLKRPLDVVRSARAVLEHAPDALYVVVGDGPHRASMEEECARLGIRERFRFTGWVDHDEMPSYMNLADVVIMPSDSEALALVYLETQACGRVLVASDIAAAREVVEDGRTGLLFRKGDVGDLTAKTLLAARDPALRATIGARARASARMRDLRATLDEYVTVLRDAAVARRRA